MAGLGRVTQMVGQDGTSDYGYDTTSQLTSAVHTFQTNESYSYDANGNRTMTGWQTGTDNRLVNDGTYSYEYDKEGNRTKRTKTATGDVTEYAWDYRNRLTRVTEKDVMGTTTKVVEYTYDVFNRRIAKGVDTSSPFDMADAAIERYVYDDIHKGLASLDGGNVVLDFVDTDGTGTQPIALAKRYLYGEAVDQILAQEDVTKTLGDAARVLWPLVDNLGTVRDLARQDGTIATHLKYDAYGSVTAGNTSLSRYLFTSRELDTETGLQYNRARWYDAEVGRWISEDPLGFAAGDGNVTRYVGNGVSNRIDPTGLEDHWPLASGMPQPPTIDDLAKGGIGVVEIPVPVGQPGRGVSAVAPPLSHEPPTIQLDRDAYPQLPTVYVGGMILPPGPGGLPPEWQPDPTHLYPHGERFRHPGGDTLDWHPGRPELPGARGRDHWHHNEGDEHLQPGDETSDPPSGTSQRIILVGFGSAIIVATIGEDVLTFGVGIWNDLPTIGAGAVMIGNAFAH